VALRFAQEGADVALNYLDDRPAAEAIAAQIEAFGQRCATIQADVSKSADIRQMVAAVEYDLGPIDVLVNNAGIFPRAPFLELAEDEWDAVLTTNLKGSFICAQEVTRRMVNAQRPGVVINLASGAPYRGSFRSTAYMASKLGIVGLTRGMARDLTPHRIRVNAVAPGVTNTAMPRLSNTEAQLAELAQRLPTGALAEPEDIADVIVFLATDDARHLIGQLIHVNGGDYLA
jgi:3-oxoacyl-[acyl-carrier protein] reductase